MIILYFPVLIYEAESDFNLIQSRGLLRPSSTLNACNFKSVEEMDLKFGDFS